MKKILSLILVLALSCTLLVGCGDKTFGSWLEDFPDAKEEEKHLSLDMYIVTDDITTLDAKTSVATRIQGYTKADYNTTLNVKFFTAAEYEAAINDNVINGTESVPNIVLITSEAMFDSLNNASKLCNLTDFYNTKTYGRLNTQIATSLINASKVNGKLFTVPNNRVLGQYSYLVINREVAMQKLHYTNSELSSYKSIEECAALMQEMTNAGYNANELVRVVNGSYQLREELSKENYCNVISVPTVTRADAFSSAFAVINNANNEYNERAMRMIYAINTDVELRNILQYGVLGANYTVSGNKFVRIKTGTNVYSMNLFYTGDVFKANYCDELSWTSDAHAYGILQNDESVTG